MSKLYTVKEVAKKLRVSDGHVYDLIKKGTIKKVDNLGAIRISNDDFKEFMTNILPCVELSCNPQKVDILETHIGKIRKLKNQNWYVLRDLCKLVGISDSFTVSRRASQNAVRNMSLDEARDYGIRSTHTGVLVITLEGIEEYATKTRIDINWGRLLSEIKADNTEIQEKLNFDKFDNEEVAEDQKNSLQVFEGHEIEIIEVNREKLFELYSTGMALGHVKKNSTGKEYPFKERIDKSIESAEIKPCVRGVHRYLTESMLYDLMLEMKTDKVKPFRKWVTGTVLPSINKTGGYVANETKFTNNYFSNFSEETRKIMAEELKAKNKALFDERDKLDSLIRSNIKVLNEVDSKWTSY